MTEKPPPFPASIDDWARTKANHSIDDLYTRTMAWAEGRAAWYVGKSRTQKRLSIAIRFAAVVLGSLGGLVPLLMATDIFPEDANSGLNPEAWGYVAIAVAALLIGADKLLGFSTTWMRFMQTHLRIQKSLTIFRYDWTIEVSKLADRPPDDIAYTVLLGHLKQLVESIEAEVEQETRSWVDEFNRSLSQLARTYERTAEQLRPGTISVSVSNADQAEGDLDLQIDGRSVGNITIAGRQIPNMPPGVHTVDVIGVVNGMRSADSSSINVVAGGITPAPLTLIPTGPRQASTGSIELTVANAEQTDGDITLLIDNEPHGVVRAGKRRVDKLTPTEHLIGLSGRIGGEEVGATVTITVAPGESTAIDMVLA